MQNVVMPTCPYCHTTLRQPMYDESHPLQGEITTGGSRMIRCERCKERYYAQKQIRFIGRRNL